DGAVVSAGGRVLTVVGTGIDLAAARAQAYQRVEQVQLPGGHYRSDIGLHATRRESWPVAKG
ncbi:MAG TPA: phosphoribosylglycinamide synthetase C domain-containing protein, partial [Pseudonocardiaceae bacterium]|nr:phosphoribosylglycinamide synthetase C domain-containing protein [Pseudonocardiaceae bacterium]